MFDALLASVAVALASLIGVVFFGHDKRLIGIERYVIPAAVGVFFSLILFELLPSALAGSHEYGAILVFLGFISFYFGAHYLHKRFHDYGVEDCDRKASAMLLLVGDTFHNVADGFILGTTFVINPALGIATTFGILLHKLPQEIVAFGVFIRAGYTRKQAAYFNLLTGAGVILGTMIVVLISVHAGEYLWVFMAIAAGNLLFLAAHELLPNIHGNLSSYGSISKTVLSVIAGFVLMSLILTWSHEQYGHQLEADTHAHEDSHAE